MPSLSPSIGGRKSATAALLLVAIFALGAHRAAAQEIDSNTFGGLSARSIGTAATAGRIAAIDAVPTYPLTLYVGAASGGVWKSTDGGIAYKPIFDEQTMSIGAIRVDPSNPKTIWVGTGESWTRNSTSYGDGIYKSTDGGDNWQKMGLADSERIARIQVSPKDSNTVWVCATGHLWNANEERGVFKTTDGGKTWKKTLYANPDTGCSDISVDPQDPRVVYAGMWNFRRTAWSFSSGGPGSGLYKSTDGGDTWKPLGNGLPPGLKGRVAVALAPSRPSVVYALVESENSALYRSDDSGGSWAEVNSAFNLQVRPFYFANLFVDPTDFNTVYKPGLSLTLSQDGGKTFSSGGLGAGPHSDHHALWIDPRDPKFLILGTDGGIYISYDQGTRWRFVGALPVSQFYHVTYDMERPYNVYGGLQDNGSWMGPSEAPGGVRNKHWQNIGSGDGFWAMRDSADADYVYSESQGGSIIRLNTKTGESRDIKPSPGSGDPDYRFNWNSPIAQSPTQPGVLYLGGQFLFKSLDHGESWSKISPDLTTNDPAKQKQRQSGGLSIDNSSAENHTTIFTVAESPKDPNQIWVGTDDGNVQLTRDGGKTWTNLVKNLTGLPKNAWVSTLEPSPFEAGTAFATFDNHTVGDMKSYVYETTDFGQTWKSLSTDALAGYAHVVRQDTVNPNLLFVGTELGLYLSVDRGATWARFTGNLPKVAVRDIAIHPREGDLILATHGRGIYIIDDLTPIRQLTPEIRNAEVAFLPARNAVQKIEAGIQDFAGDDEFSGDNPDDSAQIIYYLKKRHVVGDLKIEVFDSAGKLLSTLPAGKRKGINRVPWSMRLAPPKLPAATSLVISGGNSFAGPRVPPGTYTVKLTKGGQTLTEEIQVASDPRSKHTPEDRAAQYATALEAYNSLATLTYVAETLADLRAQVDAKAAESKAGDPAKKPLEALSKQIWELYKTLVATGPGGWLSGEEQLREKLTGAYGGINGYDGRPTQAQLDAKAQLEKQLAEAGAKLETFRTKDVPAVNRELAKSKREPLKVQTREEWEQKQKK
ncbi:MAG: glycosyl hydrolase [Acidobacteriota bacterium]